MVVGKHPLVSRLLNNRKPPRPRYSTTWDVAVVLGHIRSWGPTESLCRKKATLKLAMLMALVNASQCSELHALDVQRMRWSKEGVTFSLAALTKMSRPGKSKALFYSSLETDRDVCPVTSLKNYLMRTDGVQSDKLFLSHVKPYGSVKSCTIARWLKEILRSAGLGEFRAHSTRGVAVSAAYTQGMSVADMMAVADWSSDNMFKKFYYRPLTQKQNTFTQSFLSK